MPSINLQVCDPVRPTTCVLMGPGRHRWEFMIRPGEVEADFLDDRRIAELLSPWIEDGDVEIDRKAVYRFHGLVTRRWREGRVLLAGDAAHQTPPFAGQGMCSGIRDAVNLAWKLALVERGEARDGLLDTYQSEREPHVRAITETAIAMGRVVCISDPQQAAERDAFLLAERARGASPVPPPEPKLGPGLFASGTDLCASIFPQDTVAGLRLDDVLGPGAWLIARHRRDVEELVARAATRFVRRIEALDGPVLAPFASRLARLFAGKSIEAILVRPDRHVFGSGAPGALLDAYAGMLAD